MPQQLVSVEDLIRQEADKAGVPPALALAVAEQESGFNPTLTNPQSGAIGTFQFLPETAKARGIDANDPIQNIRGGVGYLRDLLDQHNGDLEGVLKTYGGVKTDVNYVPGVLGRLKKFSTDTGADESAFRQWYAGMASKYGLGPDPDAKDQYYDYRAAFRAGATPDATNHWPSQFKKPGHPNEIVGGFNTRTGERVPGTPRASEADLVKLGWDPSDAKRLAAMPEPDSLRGRLEGVLGQATNNYSQVGHAYADAAAGFGKEVVNRSTQMMDLVRQKVLGLPGERPQPYAPPTTTAGKVGAALEPVAEFAVAAPLVGSLGGGTALQTVGQGLTAHALTKSQGGSDTAATFNAALSAAGPLASKAIAIGAPKIRQMAVSRLSKTFAKGLENKGPMVDYALKTGDAGTRDVAKSVEIVQKAASDTLDLPIQSSWGKWQTTLAKDVSRKGEALEQALQGPLGSVEVPKADVLKALDDLEETTKHFAETAQPPGAQGYAFGEVTHNKELAAAIRPLRDQLAQYADHITLRNLTDIKRTWDSYVYTLSTAGKVGMSTEAIASTAMKDAMLRGANGIRSALETAAPDVAKLNEAVTDAIRLQDLVTKLYKVNPAFPKNTKNLIRAAGAATGVAIGHSQGLGWAGSIVGAQVGASTARMLMNAMESPLWQQMKPRALNALATALASGNADATRQILTPVLAGTASGATQPSVEGTAGVR